MHRLHLLCLALLLATSLAPAATYYVAPGATSTNWSAATSMATPCTPSTAMANAVAGDQVYFLEGQYDVGFVASPADPYYHSALEPAHSGTDGSPITFAAHPGANVVMNGLVSTSSGTTFNEEMIYVFSTGDKDYIIFDGFKIQANGGTKMGAIRVGSNSGSSDRCIIRNCIFNGGSEPIHNINGQGTDQRPGIRIERTKDLLIQKNILYNYRNVANMTNTMAIRAVTDINTIVERNEIYNCTQGFYAGDSKNCSIRYNYIHDNGGGVNFTGEGSVQHSDHRIYHNVFARNSKQGVVLSTSDAATGDNFQSYNNTFFGLNPSYVNLSLGAGKNRRVCNNLFQGDKSSEFGIFSLNATSSFPSEIAECDFNQFGAVPMSFQVRTHSMANIYTNYTTLASWQASNSLAGGGSPDVHSLTSDPLFENTSGTMTQLADFALRSESPCRGTGKDGADMGALVTKVGPGGISVPDIGKPTAPTGLAGISPSSTQISLTWLPSSDDSGIIAGYKILRDGTQVGIARGPSFGDTGLRYSTAYSYAVVAYDEANNDSAAAAITVTTVPSEDVTPPPAPANVSATAVAPTSLIVTWNPSVDPTVGILTTGLAKYRLYRGAGLLATINYADTYNPCTYTVTGLSPSTSYTFRVEAVDAANNVSVRSDPATVVTPPVGSVRGPTTIYVDNRLVADVTDGGYSIAGRNHSGNDGNAYVMIQAAVNAMQPGDKIVVRGGTYLESVHIPATKDGSAWAEGKYNKISSYPGEWAVIDVQNQLRPGMQALGNAGSYLKYWWFEKLEIKNASATGNVGTSSERDHAVGLAIKGGPFKVRWCSIHDNMALTGSNNPGGIVGRELHGSVIEYNYFVNNGSIDTGTHNSAHALIYSDYNWNNIAWGGYTNPTGRGAGSVFRYNYFDTGATVGLKYKGDQLFSGRNIPDKADWDDTYQDFGDKVHHNIFKGASSYALGAHEDFMQVFNNIIDSCTNGIMIAYEPAGQLYKVVSYNNTILNVANVPLVRFGRNQDSYTRIPEEKLHFGWDYNNLISGSKDKNGYSPTHALNVVPIQNPGSGGNDILYSLGQYFCSNNYIHKPQTAAIFRIQNLDYTAAQFEAQTLTQGPRVVYYDAPASPRTPFMGTSGSAAYRADGEFELKAGIKIKNGGIGGAHPYLPGVTIPFYVGAVNPNDSAWVDGVLGLANTGNLQNGSSSDAPWIEGAIPSSDSTPPTDPTALFGAATSPNSVFLTWLDASDNFEVVGYRIYRNGALVGATDSPNYADISLLAGCTYSYQVAAFDAAMNVSGPCAPVSVATPAANSFAAWRVDSFGADAGNDAIAGPNADPDGAGLTNFARYAFGLAARGRVAPPTALGTVTVGQNRFLTLTFPRRAVATGLSYSVESSTDLIIWTPVPGLIYAPGASPVTAQDTVALGAAGPRRFLRVRITQP